MNNLLTFMEATYRKYSLKEHIENIEDILQGYVDDKEVIFYVYDGIGRNKIYNKHAPNNNRTITIKISLNLENLMNLIGEKSRKFVENLDLSNISLNRGTDDDNIFYLLKNKFSAEVREKYPIIVDSIRDRLERFGYQVYKEQVSGMTGTILTVTYRPSKLKS